MDWTERRTQLIRHLDSGSNPQLTYDTWHTRLRWNARLLEAVAVPIFAL